jgi:hypothetical protein
MLTPKTKACGIGYQDAFYTILAGAIERKKK